MIRLTLSRWWAAAVLWAVFGGAVLPAAPASEARAPLEFQFAPHDGEAVVGFSRISWQGTDVAMGDLCGELNLVVGEQRFESFRVRRIAAQPNSYRVELAAEDDVSAPVIIVEMEEAVYQMGGIDWRGFRYRYRLENIALSGAEIVERIRWRRPEIGENPTYWIRSAFMATEYVVGQSPEFSTPPGDHAQSRFGKIIPFDFHDGEGKALLVCTETLGLILNRTTAASGEAPLVEDRFIVPAEAASTPWKTVLWSDAWPRDRQNRINRFNDVWLDLRRRYRATERLGELSLPEPWVILGPRLDRAEAALARARELGFRRIGIGPIWTSSASEGGDRSAMSAYDFTLAKRTISTEQLTKFCKTAASYGIDVIAWFPFVHLSDHSPVLKEHPEWIARSIGSGLYKGRLLPLDLGNAALRARLKEQLAAVRATGVAGFWLDSFHNFAIEVVGGGPGERRPTYSYALELVREMEAMGFTLYAEALTPFAIASCGLLENRIPFYRNTEYRIPAGSLYVGDERKGTKLESIDYFAFLAFGSPPLLYAHLWADNPPFGNFSPAQQDNLATWHAQYAAAKPEMKRLLGLVLNEKAVLWEGADAQILFALGAGELPADARLSLVDLKSGARLSPINGRLALQAQTVYRVEGARLSREQPGYE